MKCGRRLVVRQVLFVGDFFFIFSFFMVPFVSLEANFIVAIKKLRKFQVFIVKMRLAGGYSMELKGVLT